MVDLFKVYPPQPACQTADFRVFAARLVLAGVFACMVWNLAMGTMPHQMPLAAAAFVGEPGKEWVRETLSVWVSTWVLLAFFLPSRPIVGIAFAGLVLFQLSYWGLPLVGAWNGAGWWLALAPACLSPQKLWIQWQRNRLLALLFLLFNLVVEGWNPLALPFYLLFAFPFLPLERLYLLFLERFEPK